MCNMKINICLRRLYYLAPDEQLNPKKKIFETLKVSSMVLCILPIFQIQIKFPFSWIVDLGEQLLQISGLRKLYTTESIQF